MAVENRRVERRRLGLYCNGLVATEMCMCMCIGEAGVTRENSRQHYMSVAWLYGAI